MTGQSPVGSGMDDTGTLGWEDLLLAGRGRGRRKGDDSQGRALPPKEGRALPTLTGLLGCASETGSQCHFHQCSYREESLAVAVRLSFLAHQNTFPPSINATCSFCLPRIPMTLPSSTGSRVILEGWMVCGRVEGARTGSLAWWKLLYHQGTWLQPQALASHQSGAVHFLLLFLVLSSLTRPGLGCCSVFFQETRQTAT